VLSRLLQAAPRYLLANRSDVAAAFSLRRLSLSYTGPAVRIRESGGSTERDFYPSQRIGGSSFVPWAEVSGFIGGGSGFVAKWYDQSGNGRDLAQSTAAAQPSISLLANGLPGMTFDGSNDNLQTAGFTLAQPFSFNVIYRRVTASATQQYVFDGITAARVVLYRNSTTADNAMYAAATSPSSHLCPQRRRTDGRRPDDGQHEAAAGAARRDAALGRAEGDGRRQVGAYDSARLCPAQERGARHGNGLTGMARERGPRSGWEVTAPPRKGRTTLTKRPGAIAALPPRT
jgi:hypothetical protein